eukprot:SAG11_NODE_100_length_16863_cov_12.374911_2_plen_92_part_00
MRSPKGREIRIHVPDQIAPLPIEIIAACLRRSHLLHVVGRARKAGCSNRIHQNNVVSHFLAARRLMSARTHVPRSCSATYVAAVVVCRGLW